MRYTKRITEGSEYKLQPELLDESLLKFGQIEDWEDFLGIDAISLFYIACGATYLFMKDEPNILIRDLQVDFTNKMFCVTDYKNNKHMLSFKDYGKTYSIHGKDVGDGADNDA